MWSQNLEEKYILEYFGDKVGTFCDIGSNDGVTLSNVCELTRLGWSGIFIEPSPTAFNKLKENYSLKNRFDRGGNRNPGDLYFYPFALGTTNGMVTFHDSGTHLNKGDTGLLSTLSDADKAKWEKSTQFTDIQVQCFRWKTFLNRLKIKKFDFISIDVEGVDYDLLSQIDLRDTSCVCVEFNGDANLKVKFDALMIGFKLLYTSPENLVYGR